MYWLLTRLPIRFFDVVVEVSCVFKAIRACGLVDVRIPIAVLLRTFFFYSGRERNHPQPWRTLEPRRFAKITELKTIVFGKVIEMEDVNVANIGGTAVAQAGAQQAMPVKVYNSIAIYEFDGVWGTKTYPFPTGTNANLESALKSCGSDGFEPFQVVGNADGGMVLGRKLKPQ